MLQLDDHAAEAALGFPLFKAGEDRLGWLFNMNTVRMQRHRVGWSALWDAAFLIHSGCRP